ncbi:vWA domain-containing protein [Paenibacillus dokdonensis]|uniref:vWA domain-containing protein n=1 Tax=Paenibacillus dokdonensis TaxID=2567944 RepID=UPI0010A929F5|nr:vWA domain-containing protein [Paenibacillus dokdonensis]
MRNKFLRETILIYTVILLIIGSINIGVAEAEGTQPSCLNLTGSFEKKDVTIDIGEPLTMKYKLKPSGTFTENIQREPVNFSLVLDTSASMQYSMRDGNVFGYTPSESNPDRQTVLKDATTSFISSIQQVDLKDKMGIVHFGSKAETIMGLSSNYAKLKQTVNNLELQGSTNIEAALGLASEMLPGNKLNTNYIILVTDGAATHYGDGVSPKVGGRDANYPKTYALNHATELGVRNIPVYTIALGNPGGSEVDHNLLVDISKKSGGKKFDASDLQSLKDVFGRITKEIEKPAELQNIKLIQPLPDGFVLDGEQQNMKIEQVNGQNQLVITVANIPYPYQINEIPLEVRIKQVKAGGTYSIEDAYVSYTDACSKERKTPIDVKLNVTVIQRDIERTDKYGNVYVGKVDGTVIRYKLGNKDIPQWEIKENKPGPVKEITFLEDDHGRVEVTYGNNEKVTWNLRPTAPIVELKDGNGQKIATGDTNYKKGPVMILASGSSNQLPGNTVYGNNDFQDKFIHSYEYRIQQNGNWGNWSALNPGTSINQSGKNMQVEVRAKTAAISNSGSLLIPGAVEVRTVSVDVTDPKTPVKKPSFTPQLKVFEYDVDNIVDDHSGIKDNSYEVIIDGKPAVYRSGQAFNATKQQVKDGKVKIRVTDNVGNQKETMVTELPVTTGLSISFSHNNLNISNPQSTADLNVKVTDDQSGKQQGYVYKTEIELDGVPVAITNRVAQTVNYGFKLEDKIISQSNRIGWHQVMVYAQNVNGDELTEYFYFLVNPGPDGKLQVGATSSKDNGMIMVSTTQNTPLTLKADFEEVVIQKKAFKYVDANGRTQDITKPAIRVIGASYYISKGKAASDVKNKSEKDGLKKLGSKQFRVSATNTSYIYLILQDNTSSVLSGAADIKIVSDPVKVTINYNQKRY